MPADSRQFRRGALALRRDARGARATRPARIIGAMALAIVACGGAAYWGDYRETEASRVDFAHEQTTLAKGVAVALAARLAATSPAPAKLVDALRGVASTFEEPGAVLAFVDAGDGKGLVGTSGAQVRSPRIEATLAEGRCMAAQDRGPLQSEASRVAMARGAEKPCWLRLSHEESAALGLPPRTSVAAISGFVEPDGNKLGLVLAVTARRHSDREEHAELRLALSFLFSSGLVLAFGTLALRTQRKELELERELAVAEAVRERDERLGRADKMAALGAMATGVAHQIASPLGVIMGRVGQLLPKVSSDERAKRAVDAIAEQTRRIEAIVRAFLGLARGGAPVLERVDPVELASAAVSFVEHRFAQSSVRLAIEPEGSLPPVACDPRLIEQAIVNLLLNACDACDPGGSVAIAVQSAEGAVTFVVTDDGVGISAADASRAKEPFFTTKPEGHGSGLGLAIANEIVAHHNGELTLAPRDDGRGTRACIRIGITTTEDLPGA